LWPPDTSGLSTNDEVCFLREHPHLVLARVLIAQRSDAGHPLLDRLLADAEAHARLGSAIEILALRALAYRALGHKEQALHNLERALALGEPEGYVRVFVDEGAPMATLLRRARTRGVAPEYCARLLDAFCSHNAEASASAGALTGAPPSLPVLTSVRQNGTNLLVERLSGRERDIAHLVIAGASNQEIAERLWIATTTVKSHMHSIFEKIDVKSRTQLIARMRNSHPYE